MIWLLFSSSLPILIILGVQPSLVVYYIVSLIPLTGETCYLAAILD